MLGKTIAAAACTVLFVTSAAWAGDITITQRDKAFSEKEVTIKAGDTVHFVNEDSITHNVYSRTKGHKFDVGAQRTGTTSPHTFASAGKVKVRCAIHPRMKLTVNVE
jgi:plastocyanin